MSPISPENKKLFEDYMDQICQHFQAVGMAVAVIREDGETLYQRLWGFRDRGRQLPVDDQTLFGLASVTKSFVALAVMQLQEQGLLSLEDPITRYLPEFSNRNQKPVRIRHLLTHSAGFYPLPRTLLATVAADMGLTEEKDGDLSLNAGLTQKATELVCQQLDEQTQQHGIIGAPGQYMSYCNDAFGLLSEIIRRVSHADAFADYARQRILTPLGMDRSGADYLRPRQQDNVSVLYQVKDGRPVGSTNSYEFAFALPGAGAMKSTLADMKRYAAMYLREGQGPRGIPILAADGIHAMFQPRIALPSGGHYGLGLEILGLDGMTIVRHGGSQPGVSSHLYMAPEAHIAALVLCNTSKVPVGLIAKEAMTMALGKTPAQPREDIQETPWHQETIRTALGTYASREGTGAPMVFALDRGRLTLTQAGERHNIIMTGDGTGIVRKQFADSVIRLFRNPQGQAFAVNSGDRLFPRATDGRQETPLIF